MITENNKKYTGPPTIEIIESVVTKFNVSEAQFERFFGLSYGTIKKVRFGERDMPSKYWHFFFDPQYNIVRRTDFGKSVVTNPVPEMVPKNTTNKAIKPKSDIDPHSKLGRLLASKP